LNDSDAHSQALGIPPAPPPVAEGELAASAGTEVRPKRRLGVGPVGITLLVGALSLILPLGWAGLWAPYEIEMADFSRRIAVDLHGASGLSVLGARNDVPILSELGKGQLPFSSVALGFQLFGLSDWAGRLPLALWAALGVAATYLLVRRLMDRVAAAYASVALATMPLYFLHARTLLGDGVTLAAAALATSGLALSTFHPAESSRRARLVWGALGLTGLLAGFGARGVLFGVAAPALGVGAAWLIWRLSGQACPSRSGNKAGIACLVLGAAALALGLWVLIAGSPSAYLELIGARASQPAKLPTHDSVLHGLGFGLLPWSAVAPIAIAASLRHPSEPAASAALRVCLLSVFLVALLIHGLSAPYIGSLPFVGTFAVAALTGIAFRDAEGSAKNTRLLALAAAALLIVFYSDLRVSPEQSLNPFNVLDPVFPASFVAEAKSWLKYGCLACLGVMMLALGELPSEPRPGLLNPASDYARWLVRLKRAGRGRLIWALGALSLLLGGLALLPLLAARAPQLPWLLALAPWGRAARYVVLLLACVPLAPLVFWLVRDLVSAFLRWLPIPRARLALGSFTAFGLTLSLGYYPALAAQLSPRNVFESFEQLARPGEELAVLGQAARVAPYYAGTNIQTPSSGRAGLDWLLEKPEQRRWLVLGARDLGQLNQLHRDRAVPAVNLPILDAISSEVLLASNQLRPGEESQNPLDDWVTSERPTPQHPLDVNLNGQLRCIGWSITDTEANPVPDVRAGRNYEFRIYWEVLAPITGSWKTFIHIDGGRRRFNGDHDTMQGKYPFKLWQKGDFVTDVHPFELEPQFSGGTYEVYFGLFSGDKRLSVRSGRHHEDRIMAGSLLVN
jgi:4-amino-4-deoxy-L-arabinose transferase-like glycosyltransferase